MSQESIQMNQAEEETPQSPLKQIPKTDSIEHPPLESSSHLPNKLQKQLKDQPQRKNLWKVVQKNKEEIQLNRHGLHNYLGVEVNNEIKLSAPTQSEQNSLVIMPESRFRLFWTILTMFFMIYVSTYFTYKVCFQNQNDSFWDIFDQIMNAFFISDICLNFFTAYYDADNVLVVNNKYIALNYLRDDNQLLITLTLLIVNMFEYNSLPFESIIQFLSEDIDISANYNVLFKLMRIPQMYFLVKIPKISSLSQNSFLASIANSFKKLSSSQKRVIKIMIISTALIHLSGCLYYLIGTSVSPNWLQNGNYSNRDDGEHYLMSIEWSLQTLTTVGFGDMSPQNTIEYIFSVFWMIIGGAFYSLMISNLHSASQSEEHTRSLSQQQNKLLVLQKALNLPIETAIKIKKQIESSYNQFHEQHLIRSAPFIEQLPYNLKSHLLICIYSNVLNITPFFAGQHINLIKAYIPKLDPIKLKNGMRIFNQDEDPEFVYFLTSGVVTMTDRLGRPTGTFIEGDLFGEIEVLYSISRVTTVTVESFEASLFAMRKNDFIQMLIDFPSVQSQVKNQVEKKLQTLKMCISVEDRIITSTPFNIIIENLSKIVNSKSSVSEDMVKMEQDNGMIENGGQQYDKSDPITQLESEDSELCHFPNISFKTVAELDSFTDQLSSMYEQSFLDRIEDQLQATANLKKTLLDKIEYYKRKEQQLDYLIDKHKEKGQKKSTTLQRIE